MGNRPLDLRRQCITQYTRNNFLAIFGHIFLPNVPPIPPTTNHNIRNELLGLRDGAVPTADLPSGANNIHGSVLGLSVCHEVLE